MTERDRPADITALSLLFVFGAFVCAACGIALLFPDTREHPFLAMIPALAIMGTEARSWLAFVGIACILAAFGLWRCSYWGFILAAVVVLLLSQRTFSGHSTQTTGGAPGDPDDWRAGHVVPAQKGQLV